MAFQDFSETLYIKTMDTGEEIRVGSFATANNMELKYIRLTLYIDGATPTNEQIRMKIYSDSGFSSLLYTSDWSTLSDITGVSSRWLGWVRVDFNRENINKNKTYYATIESQNYTRILGTYDIGFAYDFPYPLYDNSENLFYNHPIQTQIFGYINRSEQQG